MLAAQPVTITVLATTDMHGNLVPVDYVTGQPVARGLAKIATLIREARAGNPNTLLIDCGDTIQGTPLESVYQSIARTGADPVGHRPASPLRGDPMMRAMNLLRYDAMTVGNHEYNAGLANLAKTRQDAKFPWISANTSVAARRRRTRVRPLHRKDCRRREGGGNRHHHAGDPDVGARGESRRLSLRAAG